MTLKEKYPAIDDDERFSLNIRTIIFNIANIIVILIIANYEPIPWFMVVGEMIGFFIFTMILYFDFIKDIQDFVNGLCR